jgi:hypothetical protein
MRATATGKPLSKGVMAFRIIDALLGIPERTYESPIGLSWEVSLSSAAEIA